MQIRRPLAASLASIVLLVPCLTRAEEKASAERGAIAVRTAMNPAGFSIRSFDNVWKQWGLKERPADFERARNERYGFHTAPFDNQGMPLGLHAVNSPLGKGLDASCVLCHAGRVAGQTIIGLGNASLDFQGFFDEVGAGEFFAPRMPIRLGNVRGTIEATAVVNYFLEFRNTDLSLRLPSKNMKIADELCEDVPAWWLMKRKERMYHTGGGHARSIRTMMPFLLNPLNSAEYIKKHEPTFADIQAYLLTLEVPKYPFEIDRALAQTGHKLFVDNCVKCHGTHGSDGTYPNKVIPLEKIGTDPNLSQGTTLAQTEHFLKTWFAQEKQDGYPVQTIHGYQAPPLDGVWATAPYFHNASAPTVYHVLNSKARPKIFTRTYRTEREDYDTEKLGLKITVLDHVDPKLPAHERRKIYDTTQPGRSNGGHTFGDHLGDDQRRAVIEYLKTL